MEENYHQPLKIADLSRKSGYSHWYLQRIFRQHQGESLGSYIRRRRLERAVEELLGWNGAIEVLALKYGYDSVHTFSHVFKRAYGIAPGEWRTQNRRNLADNESR